jgi:PST family polysaccharide transporter
VGGLVIRGLREKTIRGGFAKICSQAVNFLVRVGSLMVLGRLLDPTDFGLVGMVSAVIGVLNLFKDFGLSTATVQRATVSRDQLSTLFWINVLVGAILAAVSLAAAPVLALFYHDSRVEGVTAVMAVGFLFNGAGIQHSALLQRQMRFTTLAVLDTIALVASTAVGLGIAAAGYGYWALVATAVVPPLVFSISAWLVTAWVPGKPRKEDAILSILRFGGTATLNSVVTYLGYNLEKVLLGRFWGEAALGMYGRAYQLTSIPTDNLNASAAGVAFAALARLQDDRGRMKSYFLKGYSLILALTLPATIGCALFAHNLILVLLGPKWLSAVPILRLLSPTILIFAVINPLGWLLFALGKVGRSLKIASVLVPVVITGYVAGLPYGPKGVALGYSAAMTLWVFPHIVWCLRGTGILLRDIWLTVSRPLLSGLVAAVVALCVQNLYGGRLSPPFGLLLGSTILLGTYLGMLLYVMKQKAFYWNLLQALRTRSTAEEKLMASV